MKNQVKSSPRDMYQFITDQIMERLAEGIIPWHKPWSSYGPATNYFNHKPYRGINALLLNMMPYSKPFYLTFKQVKELVFFQVLHIG